MAYSILLRPQKRSRSQAAPAPQPWLKLIRLEVSSLSISPLISISPLHFLWEKFEYEIIFERVIAPFLDGDIFISKESLM